MIPIGVMKFEYQIKSNVTVEDHRGLGGNIINRLDNGAFTDLIYSLLVLTDYNTRLHSVTTSSICSTSM